MRRTKRRKPEVDSFRAERSALSFTRLLSVFNCRVIEGEQRSMRFQPQSTGAKLANGGCTLSNNCNPLHFSAASAAPAIALRNLPSRPSFVSSASAPVFQLISFRCQGTSGSSCRLLTRRGIHSLDRSLERASKHSSTATPVEFRVFTNGHRP